MGGLVGKSSPESRQVSDALVSTAVSAKLGTAPHFTSPHPQPSSSSSPEAKATSVLQTGVCGWLLLLHVVSQEWGKARAAGLAGARGTTVNAFCQTVSSWIKSQGWPVLMCFFLGSLFLSLSKHHSGSP